MNTRKDTISTLKICRFCLTQDVPVTSLYGKKRTAVNLPLKILSCVSVEIFPSDKMPTYICDQCRYFMNLFYDFKQLCRQADEAILHYVQDNKPIKAIMWPTTLRDCYKDTNDMKVMKTVVEDGTTVQVTHDVSDSEEDEDENIYNVKINNGSDEVSKTCVKVVASRDNEDKSDSKGSGEQCWACDECHCTYPLQQLLELHKIQKHRERNVACDQCDSKFYTKYDLAIHQLRHSDAMPYPCVACGKRFKRQILLKRHEKLVHGALLRRACPQCPASFLSRGQLAVHSLRHERAPPRTHACASCDKKFLERSTLRRHIHMIHNTKLNFACEYCPQRFASVTKLSRHVRTHAGERPYPCKYCDKRFTKSHHYTRHVRLKHRAEERAGDAYRCEQCDECFGNQDALIYHSAIHATQDLTCPLCQERFDDVDAVTAHIKTHVNGTEFMCDFCELVFTTKDKLDNHMLVAHEEEYQNELGEEESSMEAEDMEADADADEDDDDNNINVKDEGDHMVIEIKKPDEFLLKNPKSGEAGEKSAENSNSEDSEPEPADFAKMASIKKISSAPVKGHVAQPPATTAPAKPQPQAKPMNEQKLVHKPGEVMRTPIAQNRSATDSLIEKQEKQIMAQMTRIETANDKSLRLLEKELQDLKRTNSRSDAVKTPPVKDAPRGRGRPPLHSSTPKVKPPEEKKSQVLMKTPMLEKKQLEKKTITKENKEPKVVKESKPNNNKEEKDTSKNAVKNGANDKSSSDDGVRRSTRPSKIRDYAKMIRVNTQEDSDSDDMDDDDDEYKEGDRSGESLGRVRARRSSVRPVKSSPAPAPAHVGPPRKRGRPRKDQTKAVPEKIKKMDPEPDAAAPDAASPDAEQESVKDKSPPSDATQSAAESLQDERSQNSVDTEGGPDTDIRMDQDARDELVEGSNVEEQKSPDDEQGTPQSPSKLTPPGGQSLKKIPIQSLPPGVKPLPLPIVNRNRTPGALCEMQIGKKVVKVQKIIMTKAEVAAMAKKGLVEMKGGTMVLKPGVKLPKEPSSSSSSSSKGSEGDKKEKAVPMRCDFDDE